MKSDYGDGTVLYINQAQMNVVYKCYAVDTITGVKLQKKVAEMEYIKTLLTMDIVRLLPLVKLFKQTS